MTAPYMEIFQTTVEKTHTWLKQLKEDLGWEDERKAYVALRAVLHVLRDRLTVEEAAQLGAQLPMPIRGFYYEGWHPAVKPVRERHQETFLAHVKNAFKNDERVNAESVVRSVFKLLSQRIAKGEIEDIKHVLRRLEVRKNFYEEPSSPLRR